jgi:hypothetical protein
MTGPLEVRCVCKARPLLAVCGRDALTGEPFVHVKAFKSKGAGQRPKLHAEVLVLSGEASIRCRACWRWHTVRIVRQKLEHDLAKPPEGVELATQV